MSEKNRGKLIAFLFLLILGICWFEPIVWLITNSFKFDADFITSFANIQGPMDYLTRLIPREWTTSNYTELFFGGWGLPISMWSRFVIRKRTATISGVW